jgi:hypothetical protein
MDVATGGVGVGVGDADGGGELAAGVGVGDVDGNEVLGVGEALGLDVGFALERSGCRPAFDDGDGEVAGTTTPEVGGPPAGGVGEVVAWITPTRSLPPANLCDGVWLAGGTARTPSPEVT